MSKLEQARAEASEHRATFLRLHREACLSFGAYCSAMQRVQELTGSTFQPGLGGNPAEENELRKLLITEPPVRTLQANGLQVTRGWGWNISCDVVPLTHRYAEPGT